MLPALSPKPINHVYLKRKKKCSPSPPHSGFFVQTRPKWKLSSEDARSLGLLRSVMVSQCVQPGGACSCPPQPANLHHIIIV